MRVVAIIQARMGSTRLPGKVLLDLAGEPVLVWVVNRTQRATTLDEIVIATTTESRDEAIVELCSSRGWAHFRGSEDDVLDRYYQTAKKHHADIVVRITSDCPLIEPEIIDLVVQELLEDGLLDYVSNMLPPRTFPRGLDVEAMTFKTLERAWREDKNPAWREHVTPYIYRAPEKFRLKAVTNEKDLSHMRWTIDTWEDLEFVRRICNHFSHDQFSWHEVLDLLKEHPEWLEINKSVKQKEVP